MSSAQARASAVAIVLVMLLATVSAGAAAVPAVADDAPPEIPAVYHGEVEIDGEPAPEGAVVSAVVDGEERGSIVVDENGTFGGPTTDDEKLEVPGSSSDDAGEPVTFLVDGEAVDADPAVEWESGAHEAVTLAGEDMNWTEFDVTIDEGASDLEVTPDENASVVADVENAGDAGDGTVWFDVDGDEVDEKTLDLDAGETERVTFETALEEGEYDATVRSLQDSDSATVSVDEDHAAPPPSPPSPPSPPAPDPPDVQVTDADLATTEIEAGESVDVTATLENLGEEAGTHTASLTVDGAEVDTDEVTVEPGETATVTFTETFESAGEYELAVDGEVAGTLTVLESGSAAFDVGDAEASDDEVAVGDAVDVTATVENVGDADGTFEAELLVDGEVVDRQSVSVDAGDTETATFTYTFDEPGEYDLAIGETHAGTVTVEAVDDGGDSDGDDSIPGFGLTVAVVGLLATALFLRRR